MVWHHPQDVILYARSSYYDDNMLIICLFSDIISDLKTCFWSLIPKNCGNVCHNVAFNMFSASGSMLAIYST